MGLQLALVPGIMRKKEGMSTKVRRDRLEVEQVTPGRNRKVLANRDVGVCPCFPAAPGAELNVSLPFINISIVQWRRACNIPSTPHHGGNLLFSLIYGFQCQTSVLWFEKVRL